MSDPVQRDRRGLYPEIDPYMHGMLPVDHGQRIYWELCGNPAGRAALVLHGGPGSGCTEWWRRLWNPAVYRTVLFDQRNCGRSLPHASLPETKLDDNTTWSLVADIEKLRDHLQIERWLVMGGSWGSTLALAYAELYPRRVSAMVLFGVTTGRREEFDWAFRGGNAVLFPEQWEQLLAALPADRRSGDIIEAFSALIEHPDADVRQRAADAWCLWESTTPAWPPTIGLSPRFADPAYRLAFTRIVMHYVRHDAWIEDQSLIVGAQGLADFPGILIHGRFDLGAPLANAWVLHRAWPRAELVVVPDAGHLASHPGLESELVRATDRLAQMPG